MYIDVGKKTRALLKNDDYSVPANMCFSLLTANGSLDLQTYSKLERDALVSCFSLLLDRIHADWRRLYEDSTSIGGASLSSSSIAFGPTTSQSSTIATTTVAVGVDDSKKQRAQQQQQQQSAAATSSVVSSSVFHDLPSV